MKPRLLDLPVHRDERGFVGVIEGHEALPFAVRRVYFLGDVPGGSVRGEHAHRALWQLMVAMSGAAVVELDDGQERVEFHLTGPELGLLVPPGQWRVLRDFAPGTVLTVLASSEYDETDYIRSYPEFLDWTRSA